MFYKRRRAGIIYFFILTTLTIICLLCIQVLPPLVIHHTTCTSSASQTDSAEIDGAGAVNSVDIHRHDTLPSGHLEVLMTKDSAPDIVHYVWCYPNSPFEFVHYLSVISSHKFLAPSKIIFHYSDLPVIDYPEYNQWFKNLRNELPNLVLRQLNNRKNCSANLSGKLSVIRKILENRGGIYVPENVWITKSLSKATWLSNFYYLPPYDDSYNFTTRLVKSVTISRGGSPVTDEDVTSLSLPLSHHCSVGQRQYTHQSQCLLMNRPLYPKDIWDSGGIFPEMVRLIFYGQRKVLIPLPNPKTLIPLIAHYVWMSENQMDFLAYLSVKSTLNVLKVDAVLLHGNNEPMGEYWNLLKDNPRVHFVYREMPETIFGNSVDDLPHVSDVVRLDVLIKYGGIYTDWDAVWVKPITDLRAYDVVANFDWPDWHPPFPDKFNMGVLIAKPRAKFLYNFLETMKDFKDDLDHWYYNPCLMPYKVYERHPDQLYLNKHLQVICYQLKCHPIWLPGYKNPKIHHLSGAGFDWRKDVYAVHWTTPTPPEFTDERTLRNTFTMFAEIGKFILDSN